MSNDFSVVVVSCDNYCDAWDPFFICFSKYWEDTQQKVFLINNVMNYTDKRVEVINTGPEESWSKKVRVALRSIDSEYLLLMLEDYYLIEKVDTERLGGFISFMVDHDSGYLSLTPVKGMESTDNDMIKTITDENIYGKVLQPALWKKSYLEKCLYDDDFSAWEFESRQKIKSNIRIRGNDYCTNQNAIRWKNGILQGKWFGPTITYLKSIGVEVDTSKREILPLYKTLIYRVKSKLFGKLSVSQIKRMRMIGSRLGIKFITKD